MGHWNHRVVKKYYLEDDYTEYSVRETFYNDDGSIYAYTEDPCKIHGESLESLRKYLGWCLKSLDQPVLVDGEVEFVDNDDLDEYVEFDDVEDFLDSLDEDK